MLVRLTTIAIDDSRGLLVEIRLLAGPSGYVLVRDADDASAAPLATQVIGPHYRLVLELRPRQLRQISRLQVFGSDTARFEILTRPMGRFRFFSRMLPRLSWKLRDRMGAPATRRLPGYAAWYRRYHSSGSQELAALASAWAAGGLASRLQVWILGGEPDAVRQTRRGLASSIVPPGKVTEIAGFANLELQSAPFDALHVFIAAGTLIDARAIALLALRLANQGAPCVVYADAEAAGRDGAVAPVLTAQFDEIRAIFHPGAQVHGAIGVRGQGIVSAATSVEGLETLAVIASQNQVPVIHLPAVLSRLAEVPAFAPTPRTDRNRTRTSLVSFIIPSRDNWEMLERTIATLHVLRANLQVEFIIVDHASARPETAECLARLARDFPVKIVRAEGDFNFSRLMNLGRSRATGDYIFSINDDIEARDNVWLPPLLDLLDRPEVGVVGACLLYPDWSVQHAGLVAGINGHALHVARGARWHDPLLPDMLRQTRTVSAVTGAVLGARAAVWDRAGGWNESLAVEFNDVDFCFRVARLGLRNVCCAASLLIHHESVSRGDAADIPVGSPVLRDREAFIDANHETLSHDDWYPANLSLRNTRMELARPPRRPPVAALAFWPPGQDTAGTALPATVDDRFLAMRWTARRWSFRHIWYRCRLPFRWRRWQKACEDAARSFAKTAGMKPSLGPAAILGDFSGTHGLSRGASYDIALVRSRHESVFHVDIHDALAGKAVPSVHLPADIENIYFFCQPDTFKDVLGLINPEQIARCYRVGRFVWETPLFPRAWKFAEAVVHEIWTPSEFCARTFRQALAIPVTVVPHAVPEPLTTQIDIRRKLGIRSDAFLGLAIMDIKSCPERKNPWDHVRAWQAAFGPDSGAVLLMKLRTSKRTEIVLDELRELIGPAQNIHVLWHDMSSEEISAMQQTANVFLSLHRSEGYGLNIHEALRAGTPVLATHWSANTEYGPAYPNYTGISCTMVPYDDWTGHYADKDFSWAQASVPETARHLRNARQRSGK